MAGPEILTLKEIADIIGQKMGVLPIFEHKEEVGANWIANTDLLRENIYHPVARFKEKISELF